MKRWFASLIIREMQIGITTKCHLTAVRITIIKKNLQIISGREGVEEREPC